MTNHHHHPKWKLALVVLSIAHNPAMIVVNLRQGYDFKEDVTFDLRSDTGFCKGLLLSLRLWPLGCAMVRSPVNLLGGCLLEPTKGLPYALMATRHVPLWSKGPPFAPAS